MQALEEIGIEFPLNKGMDYGEVDDAERSNYKQGFIGGRELDFGPFHVGLNSVSCWLDNFTSIVF